MKKEHKIIIRCDVGQNASMGHYTRCKLIKKAFENRGAEPSFIAKSLGKIPDNLLVSHDKIIRCDFSEELELELDQYQDESTVFVLDLLHKENVNSPGFEKYLEALSSHKNSKIFLIEGLGSDSCPKSLYPFIDGLFTPYLQFKEKKIRTHLGGREYLLIDPDKIVQEKNISSEAKNILITFGGSDLSNQNQKILSYLAHKNIDCAYKIVAGPLVSHEEIKSLESYKQRINLDIIHNPTSMKNLFEWADIAITNTGQTRYELAASGVPVIIMPFDQNGYDNSLIFKDLGIAYLYPPNIISDDFDKQLQHLLEGKKARLKMSKKGREFCFNLKGANNIVNKIFEVI